MVIVVDNLFHLFESYDMHFKHIIYEYIRSINFKQNYPIVIVCQAFG